jgi:diadenosine tetraphosphate (Ap4A) HIT family hydrolase
MSGDELDEADEMEMSGAGFSEAPAARLDAADITRRAREASGPDGRLPLPVQSGWPIFPFETDGLRMRTIGDPVLPEPLRHGEAGPEGCWTCTEAHDHSVWADDRWLVTMTPAPLSLPALTLHPRPHIDFHHLTDEQGAELGTLLVRAQRALASIEGVGRVHVYKWGDGGAHLHVFLVARPAGMIQLKGMYSSTWMYALPPLPADEWAAVRAHVAGRLSAAGS